MTFIAESLAQPQEILRLLELAHGDLQLDVLMAIENDGKYVDGEQPRKFADGKKRELPLLGYHYCSVSSLSQGISSAGRRPIAHSPFLVVRKSDAASASIAQLFYNNANKLTVTISIYKSGGDASTRDSGSPLEFVMKQARVSAHAFVAGGPTGGLNEVVAFDFRGLTIQSAPQRSDGTIGAVRSCEYIPVE
jgi:hypothetical protein